MNDIRPRLSVCESNNPITAEESIKGKFLLSTYPNRKPYVNEVRIPLRCFYELGIEFYLFVSYGGMKRHRVHV